MKYAPIRQPLPLSSDWVISEDGLNYQLNSGYVHETTKRAVKIKMQIEEAAMREALIELGWTPPPVKNEN